MAAPNLRVVRRPKGALTASVAPTQALVAASAPVTDPAEMFRNVGLGGRRRKWQEEAWDLYDSPDCGELGFYVRWRANSCSRVRLVASEINPETGEPTGSLSEDNDEAKLVAKIARDIAGGPLGQSELIKRMVQVITLVGEIWVAVLQRPEGEKWVAVTPDEVEDGPRGTKIILLPDGQKHEYDPSLGDGMFRVWNPHAKKASEPDSPVRGARGPLREIVSATKKIRNVDLSKLIGNGILAVPSEASLPSANAPVSADKPAGSPEPPALPPGKVDAQLTQLIVRQAMAAVEEGETSMASLVPIIISMPGEHLGKIAHIKFSDEITAVELQKRTDGISRFAMAVDMSPEQMLGLGSTSNHWSSFILADQDVQLQVTPVMTTLVQAFDIHAFKNALVKNKIDPNKYVLWFDTSDLTADPDLTDEAEDAFKNRAITSEAYVRIKGLPDEARYDLTSREGIEVLARDEIARNPDPAVVAFWAQLLPPIAGVEFPTPPAALPPVDNPDDDESGAEEEQEPKTEDDAGDDSQQAAAARGISMAMELMVTRALELAGKRRVRGHDPEQAMRLRDVSPHDYHRLMEPVVAGQVPKLIKGWDVGLDELAARYGLDANVVRSVVERRAREQLTAVVVDA